MIRQAIVTKYLPATNTRGSRIKASAQAAGSVIVPWDDALGIDSNHVAAAKALQAKYDWKWSMATGVALNGDYVHVMLPDAE